MTRNRRADLGHRLKQQEATHRALAEAAAIREALGPLAGGVVLGHIISLGELGRSRVGGSCGAGCGC